MNTPNVRRANTALGVCIICALFGLETVVADHFRPNAASPWIWAGLGLVGAGSLVASLWFRRRARDESA